MQAAACSERTLKRQGTHSAQTNDAETDFVERLLDTKAAPSDLGLRER
jgi:hypothetical protein